MNDGFEIRESVPKDLSAIEDLYPHAFPDEDLLPLVRELLGEKSVVLSLVATAEAMVVGHVAFSTCGIVGGTQQVALLAPLAVAPAWQGRGVGSALVRAGVRRQETAGMTRVYVLGDPAYYSRFGFAPDDGVAPPYPLPDEWRDAWQSLSLGGDRVPIHGVLSVPRPWRQQALWTP